jgi:hypothetical protein
MHIGTNRAAFAVAPRPHTLSKVDNTEDLPAEFNLINDQRPLEGIQDETYNELVVTRRMVLNCGTFDDNGNFDVTGIPDIVRPDVIVVWVDAVLNPKIMSRSISFDMNIKTKVDLANRMNTIQRRLIESMISGFSAGNFEPIEFVKSKTFRRQAMNSIQNLNMPLTKLVELSYLTRQEAAMPVLQPVL